MTYMQTENLSKKEQLVQIYRFLHEFGLNDSHSGNASIRIDNTVWVTPSGACADTLTSNDLIKCTITEKQFSIPDGASLDAPLHLKTYIKNTYTKSVLHSHNPHALALTMDGMEFTPIDFEGAYYFERVPVIEIPYQDYVKRAPDEVSSCLVTNKACIVKGHGIYVAGESLNLAYKWTSSLELSAKISFLHQTSKNK